MHCTSEYSRVATFHSQKCQLAIVHVCVRTPSDCLTLLKAQGFSATALPCHLVVHCVSDANWDSRVVLHQAMQPYQAT